ncbi:hypothetical protein SISSUDRAFT_553114 [Sistotremastrum suecicum HHB10207 ss-3]|uniref:Uncharacterized protein n=1 Tax=Sistotremastrum suecicum HHB10207 ss-3 TaxID=1314776 RepID=A0A165XLU8_9AGAM|nr:hypothetical protein SISSUDRAFT_553114 [Sistotremastrum suecicum HHB10207 ss-3]
MEQRDRIPVRSKYELSFMCKSTSLRDGFVSAYVLNFFASPIAVVMSLASGDDAECEFDMPLKTSIILSNELIKRAPESR